MHTKLLASIAIAMAGGIAAAQSNDSAQTQRPTPATKLEAFSAKTGVVMIKGFTTIGRVRGTGIVSVDAREFRDASSPQTAQYGIAIEVKEAGRIEREARSFIDADEIDSLVRGIDYVSKLSKSVTTLKDFEAEYRTRGDFAVTVFSDSSGGLGVSVSSGRIGRTSVFLKVPDLEQLKMFILEAKSATDAARTAPRQ